MKCCWCRRSPAGLDSAPSPPVWDRVFDPVRRCEGPQRLWVETTESKTRSHTIKFTTINPPRAVACDPNETTVLCITGNGLKTTDALAGKYELEEPIAPKIAEFEKYMERTLGAPDRDSSDKDVPETVGA